MTDSSSSRWRATDPIRASSLSEARLHAHYAAQFGTALGISYLTPLNAYPCPGTDRLTASLAGGGRWHTQEWIGAVLPGSYVTGDAAAQEAQVRAFLDSALEVCRALVRG